MATVTRSKRGRRTALTAEQTEARQSVTRYVTGLLAAAPATRAADLRRVMTAAMPAALGLLAEVLIGRLADPGTATRAAAIDALATLGPAVLRPLTAALTDRRVRVVEGVAAVLAAVGPRLTEEQRADLIAALAIPAFAARSAAVARALGATVAVLRDHPSAEPSRSPPLQTVAPERARTTHTPVDLQVPAVPPDVVELTSWAGRVPRCITPIGTWERRQFGRLEWRGGGISR